MQQDVIPWQDATLLHAYSQWKRVKKPFDMLVRSSYCLLCFQISRYENESILLAFSVSGFGFFALALLPVGLELGVECTYPVAEATSAALLWLFG